MQVRPYPIITITRVVLIALLFSAILFLAREWFLGIFGQLLGAIWLVAVIYASVAFIHSRFKTLSVEGQTLTYRSGILSSKSIVVPFSKITERAYDQKLLERVFGIGTLKLDSMGGSTIVVENIRYPEMKAILAAIDAGK